MSVRCVIVVMMIKDFVAVHSHNALVDILPIYGNFNGNLCTATVLEQDEERWGDTS